VLSHEGAHPGVGWESAGIVRWAGGFTDDDEDGRPRFRYSFNPADAAIIVCDEDPTASLIEQTRLEKDAVRAIGEPFWPGWRRLEVSWTICERRGSRPNS